MQKVPKHLGVKKKQELGIELFSKIFVFILHPKQAPYTFQLKRIITAVTSYHLFPLHLNFANNLRG